MKAIIATLLSIVSKILSIFEKTPEQKAEKRIEERKYEQRKANEARRTALEDLKLGRTTRAERLLNRIFDKYH